MFLALLVGFLILLLVTVLLMMQSFELDAEESVRTNWERVADFIAADASESAADSSALEARLGVLRARYDIAAIVLQPPHGRPIVAKSFEEPRAVETLQRSARAGTLQISFDVGRLRAMRRTFLITAIITLLAASTGTVLLMLYIPTITKPIEAMLESAGEFRERGHDVDEREYLIETFRQSISTLKAQESELQRLHGLEKTRADDLERVTAALTRSLTSGFVALDPEARIVDINSSAREILRPSREEIWGLTPSEAFGENAFSAALVEAVRAQSATNRAEVTIAEGETAKVIGLTTVPLISEEHHFLGTLALFTDLTPLRDLELRLRDVQSLADLGEISAGIAHEFRNSLAAILGYLRLARRSELPADGERAVANAERESAELAAAVDALLAFARPMKAEMQPVNLRELTQEAVDRLAGREGIDIEVSGGDVVALADPALLARAIDNLLRNAIDSVRQRGAGEIAVTIRDLPEPEIEIADSGMGIDPADVARLFLPFQSDRPGGYGLGLPLAKKIALLHDGTLQLSGERGKGAVATIRLGRRS